MLSPIDVTFAANDTARQREKVYYATVVIHARLTIQVRTLERTAIYNDETDDW